MLSRAHTVGFELWLLVLEALLELWVFGGAEHSTDLPCPDVTLQDVIAQHLQKLL